MKVSIGSHAAGLPAPQTGCWPQRGMVLGGWERSLCLSPSPSFSPRQVSSPGLAESVLALALNSTGCNGSALAVRTGRSKAVQSRARSGLVSKGARPARAPHLARPWRWRIKPTPWVPFGRTDRGSSNVISPPPEADLPNSREGWKAAPIGAH